MKRWLPLMILLLPVLLSAMDWNAGKFPATGGIPVFNNGDRAWRISEILLEHLVNGSYIPHTKFIYSFNVANPARYDTLTVMYWTSGTSSWNTGHRIVYFYDSTNTYVTSSIHYQEYFSYMMPKNYHYYIYDSQNRLSLYDQYYFDLDDMAEHYDRSFYYSYPGANGLEILEVDIDTENMPTYWLKTTHEFDTQGRISTRSGYVSSDSTNWEHTAISTIQYHASDSSTYADMVQDIALNRAYAFEYGYQPPYYSYGAISSQLNQSWDGESWTTGRLFEYIYTPSNQLTYSLEKLGFNGVFENYRNRMFIYNDNGTLSQDVSYEWSGTTWIPVRRHLFTWNEYTSADDDVMPPVNGLQLYASPNPFADNLSIRIETGKSSAAAVSVYNAKGQLIRKLESPANNSVSWDGRDKNNRTVPNGIYFIRATSDGQTRTAKVLKMN